MYLVTTRCPQRQVSLRQVDLGGLLMIFWVKLKLLLVLFLFSFNSEMEVAAELTPAGMGDPPSGSPFMKVRGISWWSQVPARGCFLRSAVFSELSEEGPSYSEFNPRS